MADNRVDHRFISRVQNESFYSNNNGTRPIMPSTLQSASYNAENQMAPLHPYQPVPIDLPSQSYSTQQPCQPQHSYRTTEMQHLPAQQHTQPYTPHSLMMQRLPYNPEPPLLHQQHHQSSHSQEQPLTYRHSYHTDLNNPNMEEKRLSDQPVENNVSHQQPPIVHAPLPIPQRQENSAQQFEDITDEEEEDEDGAVEEEAEEFEDEGITDGERNTDDEGGNQDELSEEDEEDIDESYEQEETDNKTSIDPASSHSNEMSEEVMKTRNHEMTEEFSNSKSKELSEATQADEAENSTTAAMTTTEKDDTQEEGTCVNRRNLRKRTPRRLRPADYNDQMVYEEDLMPNKHMPRKRGKKKGRNKINLKQQHCKWDNEAMLEAIKAVCSGEMKLYVAAKNFNVPTSTLRDRVWGRVKHGSRPGPGPLLTPEEESEIVAFLLEMKNKGYGIVGRDIQIKAKEILNRQNRKLKCADGMPSGTWLKGFRSRHCEINDFIKTREELIAEKIPLIFPEYATELAEKRRHSRATYHQWKDDDMQLAMNDVQNDGLAVQEAARRYKVPSSTLRDRLSGKIRNSKPGPKRLLTDEEEQEVISFCLSMRAKGYGLTRTDFLLKSTEILQRPNREKKYTKGIPDHNWWLNFRKRHPEVTEHVKHRTYWKAHNVPILSDSTSQNQSNSGQTTRITNELKTAQVMVNSANDGMAAIQNMPAPLAGDWNMILHSAAPQFAQMVNHISVPKCNVCTEAHSTETCPYNHPAFVVQDKMSTPNSNVSSFASVPEELFIAQSLPSHGLGIFVLKYVKTCTQFGPLKGRIVKLSDIGKNVDERFVWFVRRDENGDSYYIIADDESQCNWLKYIRPSYSSQQPHNLQPVWKQGMLFFTTNRDIYPGEELSYLPVMYEQSPDPAVSSARTCVLCKHAFAHPLYLQRHVFLVHTDHPQSHRAKQNKTSGNTQNNDESNENTESSDHMSLQAVLEKNKIQCNECGKYYLTRSSLSYHRRIVHSTSSVSCEVCNKVFKSIFLYRKHVKTTHTKEYYRKCCDRCGKKFPDVFQLKVHMLTHSGVRPYQCTVEGCTQSFRTKQCMQIHYRKVHGFENSNMPKITRSVPLTFESMSGGAVTEFSHHHSQSNTQHQQQSQTQQTPPPPLQQHQQH